MNSNNYNKQLSINKMIFNNNIINIINKNKGQKNNNNSIKTTNSNALGSYNQSKDKSLTIKKNEINSYIEYELNILDYEKALKYDKRTFCQYYLSLIYNIFFASNKCYNNLNCLFFE